MTGKGLEAYTSMSPETANEYDDVKKVILKRYQLTEEGFRLKFRNSKPDDGETVFQFAARLTRYFERWIEMSGIKPSLETLMDLVIREQFMQTCSVELSLFLRERIPDSMETVVQLTESYTEAHRCSISGKSNFRISNNSRGPVPVNQRPNINNRPQVNVSQSPKYCSYCKVNNHWTNDCNANRMCFFCGKKGHIATACPQRRSKVSAAAAVSELPYREETRTHQNQRPNSPSKSVSRGRRRRTNPDNTQPKISAMCICISPDEEWFDNIVDSGEMILADGKSLPVISGACAVSNKPHELNLNLQSGYVGTTPVQVLRDTGCELAAVRECLVRPDQMIARKYSMIAIDGRVRVVPAAIVGVNTPYYSGQLEVMVLPELVCDLVVGNVCGVTDTPSTEWIESERVRVDLIGRGEAEDVLIICCSVLFCF